MPAASGARWRRDGAAWAALCLLVLSAVLASRSARPGGCILAVGAVQTLGMSGADPVVHALPEILSTHLAGVPGIEVVSRAHVQELLAGARGELSAARRAGARQMVTGELYIGDGQRYRLELRQIDTRSGRVRNTYGVEAANGRDLVQQATDEVAKSLGRAGEAGTVRAACTLSD